MGLKRNTYLEINVNNIKNNIKEIINYYNEYEYYIGVVKADNYGHGGIESVKAVIAGGCNYVAVATLEEALFIREKINDIPILCLGVIPTEYIGVCREKNITITIPSLEYMKELQDVDLVNLKAHLKINTGMNRLGVSDKKELELIFDLLEEKNLELEGIYTHLYEANNREISERQLEYFGKMLEGIDKRKIKIVHVAASDGIINHIKSKEVNGCRIGIMMYGFTNNSDLNLQDTFSVYSEVVQMNILRRGETLGYNAKYVAKEEIEKVAVVPIGYADGIIRKNTGRFVYINDKEYKIVGNICMDMLFVKVDETIKCHDRVIILKNVQHIKEVARYLETIPYEVMCSIGKRVERKYILN